MPKDPKKLREQAKKLLAEADKIEQAKYVEIGKAVLKFLEQEAPGSLDDLKAVIEKING
ncbi:MAG: hypothetical protein AB1553_05640 [Nitrospirota bacterium]